MENEGGRIWFSQGLDNSELKKGVDESIGQFKKIGDKAIAEGARIDKAYQSIYSGLAKYQIGTKDELLKAIEVQKKAIADLEAQFGKANAAFYNVKMPANPDDAFLSNRNKARKLLDESKIELQREKKALEELETAYKKILEVQEKYNNEKKPEKVVAYRTQILELTNEMTRLREAGRQETEEYRLLEEELKRVGTAYAETNKAKKLLTQGGDQTVAGIMSGISGLAGAFSAFQGVSSMFVKDNERLAAIQTKLQQAMAITIGLQQVSSTLHSTSAFRIKTVAQVSQLWNSAIQKLNVQLGLSVGLSKVLMVSGIGLLIAGIAALVSWYQKWSDEQDQINKIQKAFVNVEAEAAKTIVKQKNEVERLIKIAENYDNSLETRQRAVKRLNELMPEYNGYKKKAKRRKRNRERKTHRM